jgi:hypothetical protein
MITWNATRISGGVSLQANQYLLIVVGQDIGSRPIKILALSKSAFEFIMPLMQMINSKWPQ